MRQIIAAVVLACGAALPASAQVMADPEVVASFLEAYGLKVERDTDGVGDPMLSSRIEGSYFDVFFYGCTEAKDCDSIEFSAEFEMPEPVSVEVMNAWNREGRYGRAYVDENGIANIEYDVNLDFEGVGGRNFDDTIDVWRAVLADFRKHIDW